MNSTPIPSLPSNIDIPPTPNCSIMEQYATSIPLRISIGINFIIACISLYYLKVILDYVSEKQTFHINTRLQIKVHIYGLILHSLGRIFLHFFDLGNYFSNWSSACEIIPVFQRCLIFRGFYNIGLTLSSMCSVALVVERYAAYMLVDQYEHCGKWFGRLLVALQLFFATCYLSSLYFHAAFRPGNFTLYYCQTIASSTGTIWFVIVPLYTVMVAQIVSRILFKVLISKSKNLRQSNENLALSYRFNLEQSLRSLNALKLLINLMTIVFTLLSIVTTTLHLNKDSLSKPDYIALVEAVHILPLYSIALSIGIRSKLRIITNKKTKLIEQGMNANGDNYFDQFRLQIL